MKTFLTRIVFAVVFISIFMTSGCAIPDLKPFADATITLSTGVKEGGDHIIKSLKELPYKKDGRLIHPTDVNHPANKLVTHWDERIRAMDALVAYSDSLASITSAHANAKSNVEAFGNSIESLGQYIPSASAYTGDVKALIELLMQTGIEIKSYHSLRKAVEKAQKPMGEIADLIYADVTDLEKINKRMYQKSKANLGFEAKKVLAKYNDIDGQRKKWVPRLKDKAQEANALEMLKKYDQLLKNLQPELQAANESLANSKEKSEKLASLLSNAKKAIVHWKKANDGLAQALKNNRQPNIRLLVAKAIEIKSAVDKLRE